MGAPIPSNENKDSPYSQRFQKDRGMTFEFIKIQKYYTIAHISKRERYMTSLSYGPVFDLAT
jgi:hypothetical protein